MLVHVVNVSFLLSPPRGPAVVLQAGRERRIGLGAAETSMYISYTIYYDDGCGLIKIHVQVFTESSIILL